MTPAQAPVPDSFLVLEGPAMAQLAAGELARGSAVLGVELPPFFVTERARRLWHYRLGQMREDPAGAAWCTRLVAVAEGGAAVGHGGFHGPPDAAGMVEIGYAVVPEHRRQGHARALLAELLRRAVADPGVRTVRATVTPDNAASLATLAPYGFQHVGEQWDEDDGTELVLELPREALLAA